jgi:hypothetical protein
VRLLALSHIRAALSRFAPATRFDYDFDFSSFRNWVRSAKITARCRELIFRARAKPCRQSRSLNLRPSFGPAPWRAAPQQTCAPQISGARTAPAARASQQELREERNFLTVRKFIPMITSKLTSKAQTAIPQPVRAALRLKEADELAYEIEAGLFNAIY